MNCYIYALREKGIDDVRYVGQSINPENRFKSHLSSSSERSPKALWVIEVLARGGEIEMEVIDQCDVSIADDRENEWIQKYIAQGCDLKNVRGGIKSSAASRNGSSEDFANNCYMKLILLRPTEKDAELLRLVAVDYPAFSGSPIDLLRVALSLYKANKTLQSQRIEKQKGSHE